MVSEKAKKAYRRAVERMYEDRCSIYEVGSVRDRKTGITRPADNILVVENEPCRLSFKSFGPANQTEGPAKLSQEIKLFIAPEMKIKEGSRVVIIRNGKTFEYRSSGVPAVYSSHQEIVLTYVKEYA